MTFVVFMIFFFVFAATIAAGYFVCPFIPLVAALPLVMLLVLVGRDDGNDIYDY